MNNMKTVGVFTVVHIVKKNWRVNRWLVLKGTLIANGNAYSNMSFAPTVDLRLGGQNGFIPDYRTYYQTQHTYNVT